MKQLQSTFHWNKRGLLSLALAVLLVAALGGCAQGTGGSQAQTEAPASNQEPAASASEEGGEAPAQPSQGDSVVNIGMTYSLGTLNPLLIDGALVTQYATSLLFLPLMELDSDMQYKPQLASSITTEDNITFTVTLDPDATWSDGEPITADDVIFTALRLTNPLVGNINMGGYAALEGFDDYGFSPEDAEEIAGIVKIDEKTLQFIAKAPISLITFQSSFAQYLLTLPKHILGDVPAGELPTYEFFNAPTVISGPYKLVSFNRDHYIEYEANENYFRGKPNIEKLNIKIVQGSQLYAGLHSGEIDLVLPTTGIIPVEDYDNVLALEGVTAALDKPLTNQLVFINNASVPDARVRKAILMGINREMIFTGLARGNGELIDGFISSYSPYFTGDLEPVAYDPDGAKALLDEAGWDSSTQLELLVDSGDSTFEQASAVITANLAEIGVNLKITVVDINTIFTRTAAGEFDIYAMQYTIPPVDPYADLNWILGGGHYIGYSNDEINSLLASTQTATTTQELAAIYAQVDAIVQEEVPVFSAYVISSLGAVNDRLKGVEPISFGTAINVHEWEIAG